MNIGIVGLGLIGGSFAKIYKKVGGFTVYGLDANNEVMDLAKLYGAIDSQLDDKTIGECDYILIAINSRSTVNYLRSICKIIPENTIVMDCGGIKTTVCRECFEIARENRFTFVGGHPMAGSHNAGFKYSRENLFEGASMVIIPPIYDDMALLERVETILKPAKFGKYMVTTPEKHDKMIAFTSQIPHIISNAYVKSPVKAEHRGFSGGSFKDMTRIASVNSNLWTENFFENREQLIAELDIFINSVTEYRDALSNNDEKMMCELLEEGNKSKKEIDEI